MENLYFQWNQKRPKRGSIVKVKKIQSTFLSFVSKISVNNFGRFFGQIPFRPFSIDVLKLEDF